MLSAQDYQKRVQAIIGNLAQDGKVHLTWNTAAEAKLHKTRIIQVQKELRLVKKELTAVKKVIHASYAAEKTKVGKGLNAALAGALLGKKAVGKSNAAAKGNLQRQQFNAIAPYEYVGRTIDNILLQLDQLKLQLDTWIVANP